MKSAQSACHDLSRLAALVAMIALLSTGQALAQFAPARMYVDPNSPNPGDGLTWAAAFHKLDDAIAGQTAGGDIWVAKNHSYSAFTASPTTGFLVSKQLRIYGGLTTNTGSLSSRTATDMASTVLEGAVVGGTPAYHVVSVTVSGTETIVIDGFTIHGGNALNASEQDGGGIYAHCGNLLLANLTFDHNAAMRGGGLFFTGGCLYEGDGDDIAPLDRPRILNMKKCVFLENSSDDLGGGVYGELVYGAVVDVTFLGNHALHHGGGMFLMNQGPSNLLTLTNCAFDKNFVSTNTGGGGGALSLGETGGSSPVGAHVSSVNCTFAQNYSSIIGSSSSGEAIEVSTTSDCSIQNAIIYANYYQLQRPAISGLPTINDSDVEGGWSSPGGSHVINTPPLFEALTDPANGALLDNLALQFDLQHSIASPCIDAAYFDALPHDDLDLDGDSNVTEIIPLDVLLSGRAIQHNLAGSPWNHGGHGSRTSLDMGAYERP